MVTATRASRRTLRVLRYSARCAETSSSPSGVDSSATQTTVACGLPSGLMVTRVASMPSPMNSRAASLSFMRCSTAARAFSFPNGFQVEQRRLGSGASDILPAGPVRANDTVARDDDRQGIVRACRADGADRAWASDRRGHVGVTLTAAVPDVAQVLNDAATEAFCEPKIDRHLELGPPLGEILVELTSRVVQPGRCAQHPRADRGRQLRQHGVVVLDVVGDADQADGGGGQEQLADWAVYGAVGDVEQVVLGRLPLQP